MKAPIFYWVCVVILGTASFFGRGGAAEDTVDAEFPGWPAGLIPRNAVTISALHLPNGLASGSSYTRIYLEDDTTWVVRWLPAARRNAHPATDCFRAQGYAMSAPQTVSTARDAQWQEFTAALGGRTWRVRQRWISTSGEAWSDVSSWFWATKGRGSAFSVVSVSPVNSSSL